MAPDSNSEEGEVGRFAWSVRSHGGRLEFLPPLQYVAAPAVFTVVVALSLIPAAVVAGEPAAFAYLAGCRVVFLPVDGKEGGVEGDVSFVVAAVLAGDGVDRTCGAICAEDLGRGFAGAGRACRALG